MRIGLALPQYDYSVADAVPLDYETIRDHALVAQESNFDSLWLSDHLLLDIAKYGGSAQPYGAFEPLVTLAALARDVANLRLGTLVMCEALRPATVLAKTLATLDQISGGRIDVGLGAGWYEPDYAAIGMEMPSPGDRVDRLREAARVVTGTLAGDPARIDGNAHRSNGGFLPVGAQRPRPPVFIGGKGDRVIHAAVELTDGWNTCWSWTFDAYRERLKVLHRACDAFDRDANSVWQTIGLYALCGESDADLRRRYERLVARTPAGVLDGVGLEEWRTGKLVGTVDEVREQAAEWVSLGVETIIVGPGALPFQVSDREDVEILGHALSALR